MRVLVCGSRSWDDWHSIYQELARLERPATIVHGDARGVDRIAASQARILNHAVEAFPADWSAGKSAGVRRNLQMLDSAIDQVIAFRSAGGSRGTDHTISEARKRGIPVRVITLEERAHA